MESRFVSSKFFVSLLLLGFGVFFSLSSAAYRYNPSQVTDIRSRLMYPYQKDNYVNDITESLTQQEKALDFQLPVYGFAFNYTWVSLHGTLFFSRAPATFDYPLKFPIDSWPEKNDPAFIGVFYSKSKIGRTGNGEIDRTLPAGVYYQQYRDIGSMKEEDASLKEAIRMDITEGMIGTTDFDPQHVIIVTWKNLSFAGSSQSDKVNSYQLVLATDQIRTYAIFNYEKIDWISNTESGGGSDGNRGNPAYVGFNAGNGTRAYEYKPYSQRNRIIDLRTKGNINDKPGRHIFRIDENIEQGVCNYEPDQLPTLVISPDTGHMLGGTIVNITGPCFDANREIKLKLYDREVQCKYRTKNIASCVTPEIKTAGYVPVSVTQQDSSNMIFSNQFYIENPMIATEGVSFKNKEKLNELNTFDLYLQWSRTNLSFGTHTVNINLYGYRESGSKPELVYIDNLVSSIANDGQETIDTSTFQDRDNGPLREFRFGMIQINLTDVGNYLHDSPALWSHPIPLGWYFRKQWERSYGSTWAEKFCEQWDKDDQRLRNFAHDVPRCPCQMEQAIQDIGRFAPDFGCDQYGSRDCYGSQNILHCVRSGQPSPDGAGQLCCYGKEKNLVMNVDMVEGGFPSRSHPFGVFPYDTNTKVPGLSHWYHDMSAYFSCCMWQDEMTEGCYQFKWRRASQDCIGYQPPNASTVFGDPHFITYDNLEYTFNGLGEYSLVNVHDPAHVLDVQGRFEQLVDEKRAIKLQASYLTSVATKDNVSSVVEVQLRPREAMWRYRLNVLVDKKRVYFDRPALKMQSFRGVTVYSPSNVLNQSRIVIMFQTGAGVEVLENLGYMSVRIYLPKSFMNITKGLLGNWSNDNTDDLVLPEDLNIIPSTSSDRAIYDSFGKKWRVDDSGTLGWEGSVSLFHHEFQRSSSSYSNNTYIPEFNREPPLNTTSSPITLDDVTNTCGPQSQNNYQCRYDYIMTLNKEFAQVTKFNADSFRSMKKDKLKTVITCGALQTPRHGSKSSNEYIVGTEVKFDCEKTYVLEGERTRWCYATGEWSWTEWGYTRCTHEDDYYRRQAGIVAGIVLGVIVTVVLLAGSYIMCVLSNQKYDAVYYYAKQAGITSGIVLAILIPCLILGVCLFGYIISKGRIDTGAPTYPMRESRAVTTEISKDKKKGSNNKLETDA